MTSLSEAVKRELKSSIFEKLSLKKNPFLPYIPDDVLGTFVWREEIDEIARYITSLIKNDITAVTIIGTKGIGKTHLLRYIFEQLKGIEKDTGYGIYLIDENNFKEFLDEAARRPDEPCMILMDNPERILEKDRDAIVRLHSKPPDGIKLIATWNYASWKQLKSSSPVHMKTARVKMKPLKTKQLEEIIKKRVEAVRIGTSPFTDNGVKALVGLSYGVPFTLVYFSEKILHFTVKVGEKMIDSELVRKFVKEHGIHKSDIERLTPAQKRITNKLWVLSSSERRGVSAVEIAGELSISRSAVVQHLGELGKKHIVGKATSGKKTLYQINPNLLGTLESYFAESEE